SQQGFAQLSLGIVVGSLLSVIVLFAVPVTLLGIVSPFAIRLRIHDVKTAGNAAGAVYALSTLGSILGTFIPVFWLIPSFGTRPTIFILAIGLGIVSGVGLWAYGGGPVARQYTGIDGPIPFDGVEIDPRIVEVGRRYFNMTEPNLNVIVADGRYWLQTTNRRYDVIAVDAYRQPYIPFYLTTREFFASARDHLTPNGVLAINAGRTASDYRLVDALSGTLTAVYPSVFVVDVEAYTNSVIFATN